MTKAAKLPMLLEGKVLAAWLELSEEIKEDYVKVNKNREQLLPHQFLAGLPSAISSQLCSLGNTIALDTTVE